MTLTLLLLWAPILLIQNAAFTWVSRARNSGNVSYHALAAVFSNGIWFASQFLVIDSITSVSHAMQGVGIGAWYTLWTVLGSIGMHHVSMKYLESGKRKVGA